MKRTHGEALPRSDRARERLREKGQFWTPSWVAEPMVAYALADGADTLYDPAVGAGAFFVAARKIGGRNVRCAGAEIDPSTLKEAVRLSGVDLAGVEVRDFVLSPPMRLFPAIVGNPPYIRHHRLSADVKRRLATFATGTVGRRIDGRAGYHVYFLLRALQLLAPGGRLAFIVPADTCEGTFAPALWDWIAANYLIEAIVTFAPEASPFPGVDTNPVVLMVRKAAPQPELLWGRCTELGTSAFMAWVRQGLGTIASPGLWVVRRALREALSTGLSRAPCPKPHAGVVLGDVAYVMRGIATGANSFFHLTRGQVQELGIPATFLKLAIGRTRDLTGDILTREMMDALETRGRPSMLFCPDGRPIGAFPKEVQAYLRLGERLGIPNRRLIATRHPWYKMEQREIPPIIFAYLGRRHARFILNLAGAVPLTCFLCVYPRKGVAIEALWEVLRDPETLSNLKLVGKSYGGGAIKVEPRNLERLPLPLAAFERIGSSTLRETRTDPQLALPF